MERHRVLKGYLFAAGGAALFSTKAIFIKLAYMEEANAALMLALRMATALPFFIGVGLYAVYQLRQAGKPLPGWGLTFRALLAGFIGYYISSLLDFEALVYITAQLERLVLFTYPMFVMFLGWLFFGARLTWMSIVAAVITYVGLVIVFLTDLPAGGIDTVIGTALVLGCALTFAIYQLLAKNFITAMGSALFTSIALSGSGFACIIHYILVSRSFDFSSSPRFFWLAAGTGFFATVLPSFLVNAGLSRISPQSTSMIATISPLITISLAVWILGEPFTLVDAIGSAMVIAGVGFYALTDVKSKAPSETT
ncbi:MAG TPA: DMT family transporter [Aestuariivirga sp.]|jgi:drug/metabolite transporter (DMT)-like permease|nr:DMT family transporter [Hyphomicrobiales bacterium]HQX85444.1 DMT family transporter [Aestuariivirga sp.]MBP9173237.1 DMT family transporter [Hyphomicrobiales bacterium]MCC7481481.1 DMT family transporter [Hyphomicrobiales bacterium]HQY73149.1 DMT family transporter [Aestuariivirga sp.]